MDTQMSMLVFLIILLELVLAMPLIRYMRVGWKAKATDVLGSQSPEARLKYFAMFQRSDPPANVKEASERFEALYNRWYGYQLFFAPAALLLIVGAVDATLVLGSLLKPDLVVSFAPRVASVDLVGISALTGAYMWVVNDFIWRARRLDFAPSDVHWGVLRLTIALPLGYAFASIVPDAAKAFVAFALGAFPMTSIMTMLNRAAIKWLQFAESEEQASAGIAKLQGVNREIVERLANEDITTITQVAYCDPVRLAMRSNLSYNFVTDAMNQALAWVYLEDGLEKIRCFGLKGAVEINQLLKDMKNAMTQPRAEATLAAAASALGQTEDTLTTAFETIVGDSFAKYLFEVWD